MLAGASAAATATAAPTTATCLCHCSLTPSLSPSSCDHASLPAGSQVLRSGAWLRPQRAAAVGLAQRAVPAAAGRGQRQRALQAQQAVRNEGGGGSSREQLQEEVHRLRAALQQAREQATALQRHNRELEDIATTAVAAVVAAKQREQAPRGQGQQAAAAAAVVWGGAGQPHLPLPKQQPPSAPNDAAQPPGRPWVDVIVGLLFSLINACWAWFNLAQGEPFWALAVHIPAAILTGSLVLGLIIQ